MTAAAIEDRYGERGGLRSMVEKAKIHVTENVGLRARCVALACLALDRPVRGTSDRDGAGINLAQTQNTCPKQYQCAR